MTGYPVPRPAIRQGMKLIFELTNLCNFSCVHCIRDEEGTKRFLDLAVIEKVLSQVESYAQVDNVALTGGEPTVHPRFGEVLDLIARHGYPFSFVTNGWGFRKTLQAVLPVAELVRAITFSLDGATEATHDRIRRRSGSYRQVIEAITLCRHHGVPVQINMTVTRANVAELEQMGILASRLGCAALGYAHCQPTPDALRADLVMNADERLAVEADIADLQRMLSIEVYLAGDHSIRSPFYQCPQLQMREFNIDYRGFLTACCTLSNYRGGAEDTDVIADLNAVDFHQAHRAMITKFAALNREKVERIGAGNRRPSDRFLCGHCLLHYAKVPDLDDVLTSTINPVTATKGSE